MFASSVFARGPICEINVLFLQLKAKELTGEDINIDVADIDTDVNVDLDLNSLARTDGIVSF
jgi:hypothetical protein